MTSPQPTSAELATLAAFDTPTICNALEVVLPDSRGRGYTTRPALCGFPALKPLVGYARTARIRAKSPSPLAAAEARKLRHDYYRYVDDGPKPSLVLIEDLDGPDAGKVVVVKDRPARRGILDIWMNDCQAARRHGVGLVTIQLGA